MRKLRILGTLLIVLCVALAAQGRSFTFVQAANNMAFFTNETGMEVTTLVIVFAGDVEILNTIGFGADMAIKSSQGPTVVLTGVVAPYGTVQIEWALGGPGVAAAVWRSTDPVAIHTIDVFSPTARFVIKTEQTGVIGPVLLGPWALAAFDPMLEVTLRALGSSDPDGAIVEYLWEWSDGVTATGWSTMRSFPIPMTLPVAAVAHVRGQANDFVLANGMLFNTIAVYTVTLTVVDDDGLTDSTTKTVVVGYYVPAFAT